MPIVKLGTYPATLTASDWLRILEALEEQRNKLHSMGLPGLAEDTQRTLDRLKSQVEG